MKSKRITVILTQLINQNCKWLNSFLSKRQVKTDKWIKNLLALCWYFPFITTLTGILLVLNINYKSHNFRFISGSDN